MKKVSIKDIAREAGVVPSTVSIVLNGKAKEKRISDELAEKIIALVKETGYQPNQAAVSLRTGRTKTLGLIVEDISNVFFATLAKAIEDKAYELGYKIVYCSTENDHKKANELVKMLSNQQVEGFLITPCKGMEDEVKRLKEQKKPVVMMDRYCDGLDTPYVILDNEAGVNEGMKHLYDKGYRKIGFITSDLDQVQMKSREFAYRQFMQSHQLDDRCIFKIPYVIKPEIAVKKISDFISKYKDLDAIFFATNYLGVHGLEALKAMKLSIPDDLAIVCFDDHDLFRLYSPGITVIKQPIQSIAVSAIQMLMKQFKEQQLSDDELFVTKKPDLLIRAST
jgi:LacI family transcriptional regulator